MPGLLMLKNCFRSQGNLAMCMSKDFSNVQAVELSFSISDASKKVLAKIGSHEEGA